MITGIDHVVVAVADPDDAAATLEGALGIKASEGGHHDALGTFNRLVWLGNSYVELIGAFDRELATTTWLGAPTIRALDLGGGFATWAVATDDIGAELDRMRSAGVVIDGPLRGERVRSDGDVVRWQLGLPARLGPAEPPFVIEHDAAAAEWRPTDRAARALELHPIGGPVRFAALDLPVPDPLTAARAFGPLVGSTFEPAERDGTLQSRLGSQTLRLRPAQVPAAGDAWPVATFELSAPGSATPMTAELFGCRFIVRQAAQRCTESSPSTRGAPLNDRGSS
jgi:catechol 2,3-dioxygenase-like lactoylglutathione lyase family enzyme